MRTTRLIAALLAAIGSVFVLTEATASAATGCTLVTEWSTQTAKAHCNTTLPNERVQARAHCTHGPGTAPFTIYGALVPGGSHNVSGAWVPWWSIAQCPANSEMYAAELRVVTV